MRRSYKTFLSQYMWVLHTWISYIMRKISHESVSWDICRKFHAYFQDTKYGHWEYTSNWLLCSHPLFTSLPAISFASRWTWRRRMVHSQFRRILQSQIKKSRSDAITSNDGSQYITSLESTSRFRNLNPNFHASCSPCLTTYSFAALVVVIPMWIENHVIHPQYALSKNNPRSPLLTPMQGPDCLMCYCQY